MKYAHPKSKHSQLRRSPCGERGLKFRLSPSAAVRACRSPCGERGLKSYIDKLVNSKESRSPCGERGLKYNHHSLLINAHAVAPRAGSVG